MNLIALCHKDFEQELASEIEEITSRKTTVKPGACLFELDDKAKILEFMQRTQLSHRVLFSLGSFKKVEDITFPSNFPYKEVLPDSFKVEVEGVKGQGNRIEIAKPVASTFFEILNEKNLEINLEMKEPKSLLVVFFNGEEYLVGIDIHVKELETREFRVFAHSASFKGDMSAYIVRRSGFNSQKKLLVGFMKDAAIAIEAALLANQGKVTQINSSYFENVSINKNQRKPAIITAFDEATGNVMAARKNVILAGILDYIQLKKVTLEDVDVKFEKNAFDTVIFHITTKDEHRINELYYQIDYVLKQGGTCLFVTRENADFSISSKFTLVSKTPMRKGDSVHMLWLLEKN